MTAYRICRNSTTVIAVAVYLSVNHHEDRTMSIQNSYDQIDLNKVRRDAENMRSEMLRSMFSGLRKRFTGGR